MSYETQTKHHLTNFSIVFLSCYAMIHGHVSNNQRSSSQALSDTPLGWCSMHAGTCQTYAYEPAPKFWNVVQHDASSTTQPNLVSGKLHQKNAKKSCHLSLFELQTFSFLTSPFSNHSYHHHIPIQPLLPLHLSSNSFFQGTSSSSLQLGALLLQGRIAVEAYWGRETTWKIRLAKKNIYHVLRNTNKT